MSFIEVNRESKIGKWYYTRRKVHNKNGYFEQNTLVKVIGINDKGYDLEDLKGNRIEEAGFDSIDYE